MAICYRFTIPLLNNLLLLNDKMANAKLISGTTLTQIKEYTTERNGRYTLWCK